MQWTEDQIVVADASSLSLFDPAWHQGVIGILASRIKDKFHRPVIAFASGGDGELKGSGRSIPGFHLRDALDLCRRLHLPKASALEQRSPVAAAMGGLSLRLGIPAPDPSLAVSIERGCPSGKARPLRRPRGSHCRASNWTAAPRAN